MQMWEQALHALIGKGMPPGHVGSDEVSTFFEGRKRRWSLGEKSKKEEGSWFSATCEEKKAKLQGMLKKKWFDPSI
ncbi:hypothetical protein SDJN03_19578, partial [Cucurbita argyrosperma subsp. sororia]